MTRGKPQTKHELPSGTASDAALRRYLDRTVERVPDWDQLLAAIAAEPECKRSDWEPVGKQRRTWNRTLRIMRRRVARARNRFLREAG